LIIETRSVRGDEPTVEMRLDDEMVIGCWTIDDDRRFPSLASETQRRSGAKLRG
jgi:hypothetical protein